MEVSSSRGPPLGTIRKPGDPAVRAPHRATETVRPDTRHFTKTGRVQHCGLSAVYSARAEGGAGLGRGQRRGGASVGAGRAPGAGRIRDWASAGDGAEPGAGQSRERGERSGLHSHSAPQLGVWFLGRSSRCGSDTAVLAQPPPPPPSRAQTLSRPGRGSSPSRRLGNVRGAAGPSSPPGRRACPPAPGASRLSRAAREELRRRLLGLIEGHRVVIFSKTYCPHSTRVGGQGPGPQRRPAPASVRARPIRALGWAARSRLRPPTGRRASRGPAPAESLLDVGT